MQFIGTATTLIRHSGFTILTDPNFLHRGEEARLGYGLRSRRITDPALDIRQLPPLDLVVLSHYHGDHWDDVADAHLRRDLPVVTTHQAASLLSASGFHNTRPLRYWETQTFRKGDARLRITALPALHGPSLVSRALPSTMGSLLQFETLDGTILRRIYVSGDTLVHDELHEIPRRCPDIDLGLFQLGGTRIMGILLTMDAEQGVRAVQIVAPRLAIPIHYDDYPVFTSPLEDFQAAVQAAGLVDRVRYLERGESFAFDSRP